ncbi:hypothetical protein FUAX_41750 (plasmid) [Fulvitalea axinellae]|uniref:Uncharacterized protein n=1 Tax=Fulvitalea axinellae TaxID=1182444 RepID=A0AAU9CN89_9BACT|nr:hypothetical protein FUAX_41750 [Fulvitalea axinellae]
MEKVIVMTDRLSLREKLLRVINMRDRAQEMEVMRYFRVRRRMKRHKLKHYINTEVRKHPEFNHGMYYMFYDLRERGGTSTPIFKVHGKKGYSLYFVYKNRQGHDELVQIAEHAVNRFRERCMRNMKCTLLEMITAFMKSWNRMRRMRTKMDSDTYFLTDLGVGLCRSKKLGKGLSTLTIDTFLNYNMLSTSQRKILRIALEDIVRTEEIPETRFQFLMRKAKALRVPASRISYFSDNYSAETRRLQRPLPQLVRQQSLAYEFNPLAVAMPLR